MYRHLIIAASLLLPIIATAQENRSVNYAHAGVGVGKYRGSLTLAYEHKWNFGKQRRLGIGVGARFTSFLGTDLYYITAPARITSESTSPLIIFKENIAANLDSVLIRRAQVNSFNLFFSINYNITKKLTAGFSIDAVGVSFGGKQRANFITSQTGKNTLASPTTFNILLISDNDQGSLNSDLYFQYHLGPRWAIKAGAQFLFTEYTTAVKVQQSPSANDRFRNKALLAVVGVSLKL